MAVVYRAEDLRHHRAVAIKVLLPALAGLAPERFLREIEIAARLTHPNILPLHDSGEADGLLYYVMPFVDGETLRDRLRREGRLPAEEAAAIAREVADALGYAHARGLVHRDVKPENILFEAGHAVVSDFGIARAIGAAGMTESGVAVGTVAYMSPEQAWALKEVDARSDVYSLGCVLHEMVTGEPPFAGTRANLPDPLGTIVARAVAKLPHERYADGREFAEALGGALSSGSRPAPPTATRRWAPALLGVAVLAAAAIGGWSFWHARAGPIRSLAVLPLQNLSGDSTQEYFVEGMHDALIAELASIGSLRVISRTSTMRYRNTDTPIPQIARELNVDGIIEASVLRSGDSVSIRVNLVRARPEEQGLWARSYDEDIRQIFSLYRDVARAVTLQVRAKLSPEEAARLATARTVDPQAYDAYLRGMFTLHGASDLSGFQRGLVYLQEAIARDSMEPLPWAGLALGYDQIGHISEDLPDAFARAKAASERARQLGGDLGETETAMAETAVYLDWDFPAAEVHFRRAIALNSSIPDAHSHYGWLLILLGRFDEALTELHKAEGVDPLAPLWPAFTGAAATWMRRPADAQPAIARSLALDPDFPIGLYIAAEALANAGRSDSALATAARAHGRNPGWQFIVGWALARAGRRQEALALARNLEAAPSAMDKWGIAQIYAGLGDADQAMRWLEAAYEARWNWMPWMDYNPGFVPIRGDPRFRVLMRKVGAPPCAVCGLPVAPTRAASGASTAQ